ncbi:MAG: response regulator [Armatimonadota bacterium]
MPDTNAPIRLLICEDEALTRETLARLASFEGDIEVVGQAPDGRKALEIARRRHPHVVLTDLAMPEMDGVALIHALRRESPATGIVVLTIYNDDERVFAAIQAGARGYVLKDSPPEETFAAIRAVARGESLLPAPLVTRILTEFGRLAGRRVADVDRFSELTEREREILAWLGHGCRNKEIADRLFISEKTVKNHISNIFAKLEINSRAEAALLAARQGLV